jgi:hypothetical protein
MRKKPLGFLTIPGLIAAVLTVLIVVGVGLVRGGVLFSPGILNAQTGVVLAGVTSHAELSGKCSACHAFFWQKATMADRCLVCHSDVAAQLKDPSTLHGDQLKKKPGMPCRSCHPDHRGSNAALTDMSMADISHEAFGYSLNAHQKQSDGSPFVCKTCHVNGYIKFDQAVCTTCHQQIDLKYMQSHLQAYGENCLACHDGIDTYGHNFDHNTVAFQLTGKHTSLDCPACHNGARSIADIKATPQDCSSCHAKDDAHQGQLGTDCGACHTTSGWIPASFDHSKSKFPLSGAHASLDCAKCHLNNVFTSLDTACYSCHAKDDAHKGLYGSLCDACHNTVAWLPPTFDHSKSKFPLTGAHTSLECSKCHLNNVFAPLDTACVSCHAKDDAHNGQFGTDCGACHTTTAWLPATFDHSRTKFPLTGAHASLDCSKCHINNNFTNLSSACASCHTDPAFHTGLFTNMSCDQCHNTSAWSPASFNLSHPGGCGDSGCIDHQGATCRDCHTVNLSTATCLKCHDSNNPGGGDGGGGG